jgi:hypothetical protein
MGWIDLAQDMERRRAVGNGVTWTGLIWLRIWRGGGLLRMKVWVPKNVGTFLTS